MVGFHFRYCGPRHHHRISTGAAAGSHFRCRQPRHRRTLLGQQARRPRPSSSRYLSSYWDDKRDALGQALFTLSLLLGRQARRTRLGPSHLQPLTGTTSATHLAQPVSPCASYWDNKRDALGPARLTLVPGMGQQARRVRPSALLLEPLTWTTSATLSAQPVSP